MRTRWLVATLVMLIAGVMAMGAIGSGAWFTDQEVVSPNTITAGKLDIKINAEGGSTLPITLSDLEPGAWADPISLGVYNQNTPLSTMAVKYRFYDAGGSGSVAGFYGKINVRAAHTFAGTPGNWCESPSLVKYEGPLKDLLVESPTDAISPSLAVNNTHVWQLCFQVDSSAGNTFQGASATFDLVFDATQVDNPGWSQ